MKKIESWISKLKGSLIGIGIDEESYILKIQNNDDIHTCNLLQSISLEEEGKGKSKFIPFRKFRKKFKKKQTDYMLFHYPYGKYHLNHLIKDSIYMIKKEIVIYGIQEKEDLELLKKRYQRYEVQIEEEKQGKECILKINVEKSKNKKGKEILWFIGDSFYQWMEMMSDFLVN